MRVFTDLALLYEEWLEEDHNDNWQDCSITVCSESQVDLEYILQLIPSYFVKTEPEYIGMEDDEHMWTFVVTINGQDDFETLRSIFKNENLLMLSYSVM